MLLADLHIHTTWSDGRLTIPEVVDLFGRSGHDVIAITDHVVNTDTFLGRVGNRLRLSVTAETFDRYRGEIESEARRARDTYGMLLIAGCELTRNAVTGARSAHALALGLDSFVSANGEVPDMLTRGRDAGAVLVACHPNEQSDWFANTYYLWNRRNELFDLIHLWELACRWDLFPPVSRAKLPFIGNSDFHRPHHLYAWKTLIDCEKNANAVLSALRRGAGLGVTRLASPDPLPVTEAVADCVCAPAAA